MVAALKRWWRLIFHIHKVDRSDPSTFPRCNFPGCRKHLYYDMSYGNSYWE